MLNGNVYNKKCLESWLLPISNNRVQFYDYFHFQTVNLSSFVVYCLRRRFQKFTFRRIMLLWSSFRFLANLIQNKKENIKKAVNFPQKIWKQFLFIYFEVRIIVSFISPVRSLFFWQILYILSIRADVFDSYFLYG